MTFYIPGLFGTSTMEVCLWNDYNMLPIELIIILFLYLIFKYIVKKQKPSTSPLFETESSKTVNIELRP